MKFIKAVLAGKTIVNQLSPHGNMTDSITGRAVNAGNEAMKAMREFLRASPRSDVRMSEVVNTCCKIGADTTDSNTRTTMRLR